MLMRDLFAVADLCSLSSLGPLIMQDLKMTDHQKSPGMKMQDMKSQDMKKQVNAGCIVYIACCRV